MRVFRLAPGDTARARQAWVMMAGVFEANSQPLSDAYIDRLLARPGFWGIVAVAGDEVVGGLTAHTLPMTVAERSEIFIFDIAVREDHQRRGVGRQLVATLRELARQAGVTTIFVPADNEDTHALDFYRAIGGEPMGTTIFTFADDGAGGS